MDARQDSANWLTYSGAYDGRRYSLLRQVNRETVSGLQQAWVFAFDGTQPVETTPLVVDGTMYLTRPPNDVVALDAATGRTLWEFRWPAPEGQLLCCGKVNRGVAILGSTLYLGTLDAHLVAIDARSGTERWRTRVADWQDGFSITAAPLAVKDLIVVGTAINQVVGDHQADGEVPVHRGHIDAYDAATGRLRWRFHTVPVRGESGSETWENESWTAGGNATWMTGSFDPVANLVYWGVAAPTVTILGNPRPGDNLYGSSVVALDADSGTLAWHFQFTPHDTHDWDAAQVPVLAEIMLGGRTRRLLITANRNGFYYVLDRATGRFVTARPFARQTWADGIDSTGRPIVTREIHPTLEGVELAPTMDGATSWWSPSYSPRTGLFYVTAHDATEVYHLVPLPPVMDRAARMRLAERYRRRIDAAGLVSAIRALDAGTGELRWEFRLPLRSTPGLLTTAGDLLFAGSTLGDFWAFDAERGEPLWHVKLDGWVHAAPITYMVRGTQYVAVATSDGLHAFSIHSVTAPMRR